jgi:hypothetical protein
MQTSAYSLSGPRYFRRYAKLFIVFIASAFVLMLLIPDSRTSSVKVSKAVSAKTNFTSVVNKMYDATMRANKRNAAHALNAQTDTNQLKQSDWFRAVQKDVDRRMYYAVAEKDGKSYRTINNAQSLKVAYSADKFSLQLLTFNDKRKQVKNDWQLNMVVKGLYADGKLFQQPVSGATKITNDNNDVEYNFGDAYKIQYHNDSKGVRQNFIVKEKPSPDARELKVSLKIDGDWVVNKVHDKELHFARQNSKGTFDNKIVYNDLKVWDANGKVLPARMEVKENNNFEIIAEVSNAAYPVTIDPLSTSPSSTLTGSGTFGNSVASAGDVNGDGYSDVIVGSYTTSSAFIYLGSPSGLSNSAATIITGIGNFGISVAGAGDVNGDGFSDVIIGQPGVINGNAYVYLGSATGVDPTTPGTILTGVGPFGVSVASAGDVNGDGFSDVVVGNGLGSASVYSGSNIGLSIIPTTLIGTGTNYGTSVATAGDVNGDGFSDVIVGNAGGSAFIYAGSALGISTSASTTLSEVGAAANYGVSVASAADVNGDGYSDVVVGDGGGNAYVYHGSGAGLSAIAAAHLIEAGTFGITVSGAGDVNGDAFGDVIVGDNNGNAYVFNGSTTGVSTAATTTLTNAAGNFGNSVAGAGDVNGDGYSDVIVGAYSASSAFTYQGSPTGSISTNTISIVGQNAFDRYGLSVSSAGDINADGYSDVIVGAIGVNAITGAAYIYLGSDTGLSTLNPSILTIPFTGDEENYGWSVAGAGDINGDGYDDVIVGAKEQTNPGGGLAAGTVYIYLGSATGIASNSDATSASAILNGVNGFDFFGTSVSSAGDINGDGYSDVIVSAPEGGPQNQGAVYIYMGSATGISSTATADTLYGQSSFSEFGASISSAGDVNGDGYSDIIVGAYRTDSAFVYKGGKNGIANNATADYFLAGDVTVSDFGVSVSGAGDVNGDGYSDVIVGAGNVHGFLPTPGSALVYMGSSAGLSTTPATVLNGVTIGDQFGASVASAGDVNGDGYSDVIVRATSAAANTQTGAAYIFAGGPTGLSSTIATSFLDEGANTSLELPPNTAQPVVHRSVASAGDVNGDGYSDVLVGVYVDATLGTKTGKTYLYYGNNAVGRNASNVIKLYETNLTAPIAADNLTQSNFGLGLFVQSPFGTVKGRLVWETEPNGTAFNAPLVNGTTNIITNSTVVTGKQTAYSTIQPLGTEFKNVIPKTPGKATKVRVRIQYAPTSVTFGQAYSPWIYSQVYLLGGNLGVLPLELTLTATTSGKDILLNWKTSNENNMKAYVVEHSLNAVTFDSLGQVAATNAGDYDFTHSHPSVGVHYYRLREVTLDGHFTYSSIVSAKINGDAPELSIYPNPASDHIVITYQAIASTYVRIINAAGSVVGQYNLNANSNQTTISLRGFAKGNYFVEVVNSGFGPKQITVQ